MLRIFLIGRHDDTADLRDRIADQILFRYGKDSLVRNVFGRTVEEYVQQVQLLMRYCRVALVMIGPDWLQAADASGRRLLDNPNDPVRVEIRTALEQHVLVAPLLVHGAMMPSADALPPDIAALAMRHARPVRSDAEFAEDMGTVYQQINTQLTWRPASLPMLIASGGGVVMALATLVAFNAHDSIQALTPLALLMLAGFLIAATLGVILSFRRRSWLWLGGIALALALFAVSLALPGSALQPVILFANLVVLLVFAVFGPRRETARV